MNRVTCELTISTKSDGVIETTTTTYNDFFFSMKILRLHGNDVFIQRMGNQSYHPDYPCIQRTKIFKGGHLEYDHKIPETPDVAFSKIVAFVEIAGLFR